MGKRLFDIQFGVRADTHESSSIWRAWAPIKAQSVYSAPQAASGALKASFHTDTHWHIALNREFEEKIKATGRWRLDSRFLDKWKKNTNIDCDLTLALRITIPATDLRAMSFATRDGVKWFKAPEMGHYAEFAFIFGNSSLPSHAWPGQVAMKAELVHGAELAFGSLWIVYYTRPMNAGLEQRIKHAVVKGRESCCQSSTKHNLSNTNGLRYYVNGIEADNSRYFLDLAGDQLVVRNNNCGE